MSTRSNIARYKDASRLLQQQKHPCTADRNDMKGFYSGLKEVWGPKRMGPVQLKSTDGMETFSDSKRVMARWSEQFQ